jgi:hypothetical protein
MNLMWLGLLVCKTCQSPPSLTSLNKTEYLGSPDGRNSRDKCQAWLDPRFQRYHRFVCVSILWRFCFHSASVLGLWPLAECLADLFLNLLILVKVTASLLIGFDWLGSREQHLCRASNHTHLPCVHTGGGYTASPNPMSWEHRKRCSKELRKQKNMYCVSVISKNGLYGYLLLS